jgi:hypothetical protein
MPPQRLTVTGLLRTEAPETGILRAVSETSGIRRHVEDDILR